jgi:hypothetical protein
MESLLKWAYFTKQKIMSVWGLRAVMVF